MMIEPEGRITYNGLILNNEQPTTETVVAPEQVLRRQLVRNGGFNAGVDGWATFVGVSAPVFTGELSATSNGTGTAMVVRTPDIDGTPTPGSQLTYVVRIRMYSGQTPTGVMLRYHFTGSAIVIADQTGWVPDGDGYVTATLTINVPPEGAPLNAVYAGVRLPTTGTTADVMAIDYAYVMTAPGPGFDGFTPEDGAKLYRWTGAVNASASEEYTPPVMSYTPAPGPMWHVSTVDGIGDPAAVYARDKRVQAHGDWMARAYKDAAAMGITGYTECTSSEEADRMITLLRRTVALDEQPLTLHWASGDRTRTVRRDGEVVINRPTPRTFEWSFTVVAPDPAWYEGTGDDGVQTYSTKLPSSTGGMAFPITFPITFTGSSATGDIGIDNDGVGGRWQFRIDGPIVNPKIIVANSAGVRTLAWSLTLGTGEYIEVDPQRQESLLQGQASRPPYLRQWPEFLPGSNIVRFRADSGGAAAKLTVATRAAL